MMNEQPVSSATYEATPQDEQWLSYVRWTLWFCGAMYLLLGLACGALFAAMPYLTRGDREPMPLALGIVFAALFLAMCGGIGVANFAVAFGLDRRAKWGWIGGLLLGALYAPSACLPFGVIILYGLLRDGSRKLFQV